MTLRGQADGRRGTARPWAAARRLRRRVPGPAALALLAALGAGLAATGQPPVPIQPGPSRPGATQPPGADPAAGPAPPALPAPAPLSERLRHNPRRRTADGIRAWEEGRFGDARAAFGRALALTPGAGDLPEIDPLALHNAGTAALAAGDPAEAASLLAAAAERAAEEGAAELELDARYNLGNASYGGGDYAAAAAAYRDVLRRRPDHPDAKHNLELALRRLAEQQQAGGEGGQPPPQDGQQGDDGEPQDGEGEAGGEGEEEGQGEQPPRPGAGEQAPEPETAAGEEPRSPEPRPGEGEQEQRLPDFAEQPDMSAEQAGALLDAVESLERERRRDDAERRARRTAGGRDW